MPLNPILSLLCLEFPLHVLSSPIPLAKPIASLPHAPKVLNAYHM